MASDGENAALAGTIVVEIGSRMGAGVCGSLLAQLGATVMVIEPSAAQATKGKWRHRAQFTAGKLSFRPDHEDSADCDLLRNLIASSHAIILSSDVDGFSKFLPAGADNERVVCDVTAYGRTGIRAGEVDSEWQVQAMSGIVETTGTREGMPVPIALPIVEFMTGVYAAASVVAALRVLSAGGGQLIDMALYDCAFSSMATFLPRVLIGNTEPIRRVGNRHAMISPWNVYEATDGWLLICVGSDQQWQRLCDIMQRSELSADARFARTPDRVARVAEVDAVVQAWVGRHSIKDCVDRLNDAQIACGPIARIDGYPREANLDHRNMIHRLLDPATNCEIFVPGSPLRMGVSPGRAPERVPRPDEDREQVRKIVGACQASTVKARPKAALSGIRIIEIGHYTTVPLSARMLASLGAEVIKIEPPEGEATRDWPPTQNGQGYFFSYMNSDKRSVMLDLRRDDDALVLRELLKSADVLIENLKPGALARRGFSPSEMATVNPALIYCSVSGFGSYSLYFGRPAYDSVVQAMSGIMDVVRSDGVPLKTGISIADLMGAEMAVLAVLAALAHRDRTGRGQYIDLSMQDIAAWLTQTVWNKTDVSESPICLIRCEGGYVIAGREAAGIADMSASALDINRRELTARLLHHGIAAAPCLTVHEMVSEPHTASRHLWFTVSDSGQTWPLLASPLRLTGTPPAVRQPMPALGRDNDAIVGALRSPGAHKAVPA